MGYKTPGIKSNLDKAKQHIVELEQRNRANREREEHEKALEDASGQVMKSLVRDHFKKARSKPFQTQKEAKVYNHPI